MPVPSQNAWRPHVHSLPTEILSIIFLLVVEDEDDEDRVQLMLVCREWYAIMLSTPGIPSGLSIQNSTTIEMVRAAIQGAGWLLNVTIDIDANSIGQDFNADACDACSIDAIEAASRWRSLRIYSFSRLEECKVLQIVPPLENLEHFYLKPGCDLGSFFEPLMTAITATATPRLTNMNLSNLNALLRLVQPDCLHIFCSLTSLTIWLSQRMESPANILPHLRRLESFEAQHLYLPVHLPDTPLPLIQTLRYLRLKSVSVQWMAGKVFPVLWWCSIIFPRQIDTIRLQPVTMPACTYLEYDSNDLNPLRCLNQPPLVELRVKSGQWNATRGDLQLIAVCYMIVPCAQSLTWLDLQVRCSEQLLIYMLSLLPALNSLKLRLDSPSALSETFFKAFVATKSNADSPCEMGGLPSLPLCLKLAELEVTYKRWLRDPERTGLLLVFDDIVSSRCSEEGFHLCLSFDILGPVWYVSRQVESIHEVADDQSFVIGISSPHGIIPLEMSTGNPLMEVPFKDAEYLVARHELSIGCLLTLHRLLELKIIDEGEILPNAPPPKLPLFRTLRVFEAENIHPSFLAGQTFHRLERCRMSLYGEGPELSQDQVTQMPVCTGLDVYDLTLLAILKLPQICELSASFDNPEFSMIWEKHIAVNVNLSGLELLHVHGWYQQADLIQILRCLPVLKSLIVANGSDLHADLFGEFVPMGPNGTSVLKQSHDEGRISAILCPMLRCFLVEDFDSTELLELTPVLKDIVTLRSVAGSPLKHFALFDFELRRKFKLVWSSGAVVVKNVPLSRGTRPFRLDM